MTNTSAMEITILLKHSLNKLYIFSMIIYLDIGIKERTSTINRDVETKKIRFSCACLVLSISFFSWCLGRAAVCDCGTPWTFVLPVFFYTSGNVEKHKQRSH